MKNLHSKRSEREGHSIQATALHLERQTLTKGDQWLEFGEARGPGVEMADIEDRVDIAEEAGAFEGV